MNREEVLNLIEASALKIAVKFQPYFLLHEWTWKMNATPPTISDIVELVERHVKNLKEHEEYRYINSGRIRIEVYKLTGEDDDYWDCNIILQAEDLGIGELEG